MRMALAIALFAVSGCRWQGMQKAPPLGGRGGGGVTPSGSSTSGGAVSQKTVTGKDAPATIVAFDGTKCVVTESRFKEIVIGEKLWCVWSDSR